MNGGNQTYNVGDTITVNGENFYLIEDKGIALVLLAKNNLKTTSTPLKQANGSDIVADTIVFSSTNYWSSETHYSVNINNYESSDIVTTDAIEIAKRYAETINDEAIGRLMTIEEEETLRTGGFTNLLYETNYWLATAINNSELWRVNSEGTGSLGTSNFYDVNYGVRPVIEISKSLIQ